MTDDWNDDLPSKAIQGPNESLESGAGQLPTLDELRLEGWEVAPDAPVWCFLPAVWPKHHRTWIPDTAERLVEVWRDGSQSLQSLPPGARDQLEDEMDELCELSGVTPRPRGRTWLLRGFGNVSVEWICETAMHRVIAAGFPFSTSPELTEATQSVILEVLAADEGSNP